MDRYVKFLAKLDPKRQARVITVLRSIQAGDLSSLDIQPLHGSLHMFRCRVGNIRIIFSKSSLGNSIVDVDFRSSVYKRLKR